MARLLQRPDHEAISGGAVRMPVRNWREKTWAWTIVDRDTWEAYGHLPWMLSRLGYPMYSKYLGKRVSPEGVMLSRLVVGAKRYDGQVVDHINRDPLDNRRANLRVATQCVNMQNVRLSRRNTSGHPGVSFMKSYGKWRAEIQANHELHYLGCFDTKEEAISVRKSAEATYHGKLWVA